MRATIRDCEARGVLTDYLRGCEKEVVSIMMMLYNEEEVMRAFLARRDRERIAEGEAIGEAKGMVKICKDLGMALSDAVARVAKAMGISQDEAERTVRALW